MDYSSRSIIVWLWRSWRGNRLQAFINMMIGLVSVAVSLSQVSAMKHAVDVACRNKEGSVISAVCIMGALVLCNFALSMTEVWVKNILGVKAQNRMQRRMLDRILRSEWRGRDDMHSGDITNRLEGDVQTVVNFLTETLPSTISVGALFLGAFCYLYSMDSTLALIIVSILPVFIVFSKIYIRQMRQFTRDVRATDSKVQSILQETIQHRMLVKTLEQEDMMVGRLDEQHTILQGRVRRRTKFSMFSNFTLNFGFSFSYLVAFGWSAMRLFDGTLTYGGMSAFLQLVNRIQGPARNLTKLAPAFVHVFTAAERLMKLEEPELEDTANPLVLDAPCGIRFENVTCAYADDAEHPIVRGLSFDFRPGSCTAILGETGAGKTTLFRLIQALMRPTNGAVYIYNNEKLKINNEKLDNEKLNCVEVSPQTRCNIVYVPQGNTLLSGSIRDNLLLGNENATDDDMRDALRTACAEFVMELPDGLDTVCSELGAGLSEGQAQRICIARALLRNRSVLLLDEATSALDPETEQRLLANLLSTHHFTVIFITHRPAVVDYCDATLNLERL